MKKLAKYITIFTFSCALPSFSFAKEIKTNTAQIQAMDKVTGRVKVVEVPVKGEIKFGSFSISVMDCQTRSPEDTPENFAFVDVIDIDTEGKKDNVFRGWMISSSPALNALEHPIYDIWLLKCVDSEIDKTTLLSKEEIEERLDVPRLIKEDKRLKENNKNEELEEKIAEQKLAEEELLRKKIEELELTLDSEIIISGFDHLSESNNNIENINEVIIIDNLEKDLEENILEEIIVEEEALEEEPEEIIEDGSPRSLIKF